ncbi:MAG: Fic family protein [Erysipelotrichaceae bacterium]|nr:Fic family protein [Erysipelotrichaceae bacterium]
MIEKEDKPDGRFYRKESVFISDGIKNVHTGIKVEYVEEAMSEFIELNQSSMNVFEKILIAHFLIETIHPYYDGNGRLGRYLLANQLYLETNSYTSFLMSKAFSNHKSQYYKAFKEARDMHEFGCINGFVKQTATILLEEMEKVNEGLKLKKYLVEDLECTFSLSKAEAKIYRILKEGSLLSEFGLTLQEIMKETGVSKRTLMYALQKFKEMDVVEEIKIGRFSYLKLKLFDNVKE